MGLKKSKLLEKENKTVEHLTFFLKKLLWRNII